MGVELGPARTVECSYADCGETFDSVREMQRHKRTTAEHDYCARCDLDLGSWDELVAHKASPRSRVHISCLFCGQDFKSESGRKRHVQLVRFLRPCNGNGSGSGSGS